MRLTRVILVIAGVLVVALAAAIASNPLRKSDADLRAWLLARTPIGTSLTDVRAMLDEHGWHEAGFQQTLPLPASPPFLGGELGGYQGFPWYTTVYAFWEFDDDDRLKDIRFQRIMDSP